MSESANKETTESIVRIKDPAKLAKLVIREGKAFNVSALECGYSESIAVKGLANLMKCSSAVSAAVKAETTQLTTQLDQLKPMAIKRLYEEITNPKSSQGIKAVELAGKFKETDWWVRGNDVQIGVFAALSEVGPVMDAVVLPED